VVSVKKYKSKLTTHQYKCQVFMSLKDKDLGPKWQPQQLQYVTEGLCINH
jgi:hypothetical protein